MKNTIVILSVVLLIVSNALCRSKINSASALNNSRVVKSMVYCVAPLSNNTGDYLWSAEPFSRISIKEQKQELFTQLPNPNRYSLHGGCLEVVPDTKEILYGHRDGLWLLPLQVGN